MALTPGTRVGHYEVAASIGAGGMGEVYRARDTKLNRDVALKVLPDAFARDPERLARFRREAQLLASLNHPNIAAIHGLEESGSAAGEIAALVLELIDGPTLADRIAAGALPLEEALTIAKQLADALEAAHELGIVHRDLKPSNVKVRTDGAVKVLDFGLAKALDVDRAGVPPSHAGLSQSPTITSPAMMTGAGVILGTAAYMAPEQAKGRAVDRRADVWAFGCVLYEMLTGRRAFEGEDVSETLAFVLTKEPAWEALPPAVPVSVRRLLRRCLEKNPARRLRDIADARLDIDEAIASPAVDASTAAAGAVAVAASPVGWRGFTLRHAVAGMVLALVAAAASLAASAYLRPAGPAPREVRFEIPVQGGGNVGFIGLSPDGRLVAYNAAARSGGPPILWVRPLDSLEARALPGTEGASVPDWSPDGRYIVFDGSDQRLKKIDVTGGPPQTLTALPSGVYQGAAWSPAGVIVYSSGGRLYRVPDAGGDSTLVSEPDVTLGETAHWGTAFLPDGRRFLHVAWSAEPDNRAIYVGSLDSPERTRLMPAESKAQYADGFLVFVRERTLLARPFDPERLQFTGEAVPIAERIFYAGNGLAAFETSGRGELIYRVGEGTAEFTTRELVWVDRNGVKSERVGEALNSPRVELSRDGRRVALSEVGDGNVDVWILDLEREVRTRVTTQPGPDTSPVWSPDGADVVFGSGEAGAVPSIARMISSGASVARTLLTGRQGMLLRPQAWSADGRSLILERGVFAARLQRDLVVLDPVAGGEPAPYLTTPFDEGSPAPSPDGRFVAYVSNEPGVPEVFVQPFPDPSGGKWQISTGGGQYPRWRPDGRELFYLDRERRLVAVEMRTDGPLQIGTSVPLFTAPVPFPQGGSANTPYDVSPDGLRFLFSALLENPGDGQEATSANPITVVLNWPARLRR
jgi:Tol biopolymer transport system component